MPDDAQHLLDLAYLTMIALAVSTMRGFGAFFILPFASRLGLTRTLRSIVVLVISLPLVPKLASDFRSMPTFSEVWLAAICLKEAFIGALIGFMMGIPFWMLEMAGNVVDFVRQAPDAQLQDPQGTETSSISGTLLAIVAVLFFLASGGMMIFLGALYSSYDLWPPLSFLPPFEIDSAVKLLRLMDDLMRGTIVTGAPLLIVMLVALLVLVILARFVPQINVFDQSMAFRNVAFVIVIQIYAYFLLEHIELEMRGIKGVIPLMKSFFHE